MAYNLISIASIYKIQKIIIVQKLSIVLKVFKESLGK